VNCGARGAIFCGRKIKNNLIVPSAKEPICGRKDRNILRDFHIGISTYLSLLPATTINNQSNHYILPHHVHEFHDLQLQLRKLKCAVSAFDISVLAAIAQPTASVTQSGEFVLDASDD
jgi:hypothetical protein